MFTTEDAIKAFDTRASEKGLVIVSVNEVIFWHNNAGLRIRRHNNNEVCLEITNGVDGRYWWMDLYIGSPSNDRGQQSAELTEAIRYGFELMQCS